MTFPTALSTPSTHNCSLKREIPSETPFSLDLEKRDFSAQFNALIPSGFPTAQSRAKAFCDLYKGHLPAASLEQQLRKTVGLTPKKRPQLPEWLALRVAQSVPMENFDLSSNHLCMQQILHHARRLLREDFARENVAAMDIAECTTRLRELRRLKKDYPSELKQPLRDQIDALAHRLRDLGIPYEDPVHQPLLETPV